MAYLIGTDEAGYGPNLGPLLVAASVWRVPDERHDDCLYGQLSKLVTPSPKDTQRLAIADSKQLYRPPHNLSRLQHGVHASLASLGRYPTTWHELWRVAAPHTLAIMETIPWYRDFDGEPLTEWIGDPLLPWQERWDECTRAAGVELIELRAVAVFSHEMNRGIRAAGSKGAVLSGVTLDLVADCVRQLPPGAVRVVCDKHGGRNQYAGLLQTRFDDRLVRVRTEGRAESVYKLGTASQPLEVAFRVGGESFLPSALASMLAKYLREQAMKALNAFWCRQVPGLAPTAGYPVDARRFKASIESCQKKLGIDDDLLWRCR